MKMETVAILSTGEMGHSVASVLGSHGLRVVTCLAGRSARTVGLAKKAGVLCLPTLEEVAAQSDLVISICCSLRRQAFSGSRVSGYCRNK